MPGPYLVSGASGFAGRHLLEACRPETAVLALVRDPAAWAAEDWTAGLDGVDLVQGTVTDTAGWDADLPPLAGIFHFAALVRHSRVNAREIYTTNVHGTRAMVRLAAQHRCRVVMLSTSGTVGCSRDPDAAPDETADFCEDTVGNWPYYHSKIIAEREARRLADERGVELVFLRPPVLLGPGDHRFRSTSNIIRMMRGKLPFLIRGGMHFVDIRDVIAASLRAMVRPQVRPAYNLPGFASSIEEFFAMVEDVSGVRATRRMLPYGIAHALASTDEWLGMRLRGSPLHVFPGPVIVEMASHYWGLSSLYARDDLGFEPREPQSTLRDTVAWLRANL